MYLQNLMGGIMRVQRCTTKEMRSSILFSGLVSAQIYVPLLWLGFFAEPCSAGKLPSQTAMIQSSG